MVTVKDLMSNTVISVSPEESVVQAARLMSRCNLGALPVCGEDRVPAGIVTDRDITLRCVAAERDPMKTRVEEVMSAGLEGISPDASAQEAARRMAVDQVRRLPVMEGGKLVGMLSLGDLAKRTGLSMESAEALSDISKNCRAARS